MFDKDISTDVKSKVIYRISVLRHNLQKDLKNKFENFRSQGLEFSYIAELTITFTTSLNFMTYKHYIEQPMPMVEKIINRKLYKNNKLIKTLGDIDLTLHMGPYENRRRDVHDSSDEDD